MAVCTTGAEWAPESAFGPWPLLQIVQAILRTLTSVVIKSVASSVSLSAPPQAKTLRRRFRKLSASKIFTQLSRVRHLVVTVCFGLKHDSQRHLHIRSGFAAPIGGYLIEIIEPSFLCFRRRDVRQQSRSFARWNQSDGK
jgi:hypothetical protein